MIPNPSVNIWAQTKNSLYEFYEKRVRGLTNELDCHAQAAEIYAPYHKKGNLILDAGGGSGYFYWSLKNRDFDCLYHLLDYNLDFVEQGRLALSGEIPKPVFIHQSIEQTPIPGFYFKDELESTKLVETENDKNIQYNAVFCLNALFCLPDYRQGLERLLLATKEIVIIRTPLTEQNLIRFETDEYLDIGAERLKSYFNIWSLKEINAFVNQYGFTVSNPVDGRTNDGGEISAGKFFPWRWVVGVK